MALRGADLRDWPYSAPRALSGPNLAKEIMGREPTASVTVARTGRWLIAVAHAIACAYFRLHTNKSWDVVGTGNCAW